MPRVNINTLELSRVHHHAFMAGRAQKLVARTDVTRIDYDTFVKECQRAARAENGPTLRDLIGRGRKLTLDGTIQGEPVTAEVVLDARCIEVSTTLKPVLENILGKENIDALEELMVNPDGPVEHTVLWRTPFGLHVDAYRTPGVPPYIAIRAITSMQLRRVFDWLYGVPIDFEIPRSTVKRARHAA